MTILKTAAAAAMLAASLAPAAAESLDVATIKCSDLAAMSQDEGAILIMWLHGYYGGMAGDTVIDFDALSTVAGAVGESCAESPDTGVMTVLKQVVGQ
jgi:hypothetical protein